jgi:hypothetical protein
MSGLKGLIVPRLKTSLAVSILALGVLGSAQMANATPACLASPQCTLDGQTFTTTGGISGGGLTFIATFTSPNQSNSSIATLVVDYLALLGDSVTYLGRQDGSGLHSGIVSISATPSGGLSGNWSLNPGSTGFIGSFVAIHAGNGQAATELFSIDSPGVSGTWATNNGHGLSNFDLFGTKGNGDGGNGGGGATPAPEPASLTVLGAALVGLGALRRRRRDR